MKTHKTDSFYPQKTVFGSAEHNLQIELQEKIHGYISDPRHVKISKFLIPAFFSGFISIQTVASNLDNSEWSYGDIV